MTFDEFTQSRVFKTALQFAIEPNTPGFEYADGFYIEITPNQSAFYLLLERDEFVSTNLSSLERKLFDYATESHWIE